MCNSQAETQKCITQYHHFSYSSDWGYSLLVIKTCQSPLLSDLNTYQRTARINYYGIKMR